MSRKITIKDLIIRNKNPENINEDGSNWNFVDADIQFG